MMNFFGLYPRKSNPNISERISMACIELETLLNQLEPHMVMSQHLPSLKKALFHSHTKVVQVAVKQLIRLGGNKQLAEQLSEDMEVVLGLIENLAHKEQRVARDCVTMMLLLSSTSKALMNLLCPDITEVIKTLMTYVAVRLLVYEFIMQLSINSALGLEKGHTCGILEDVINDLKKKESYLTVVHYHQLQVLAATTHGRNYLVKYDAMECVSKQSSDIARECMSHLINVVPVDLNPMPTPPRRSTSLDTLENEDAKSVKENIKQKNPHLSKSHRSKSQPLLHPVSGLPQGSPMFLDQLQQRPFSPRDYGDQSSSQSEKCPSSIREVHLTSSSSSLSSPCDSLDSSSIGRKQDDTKDLVSDSSSQPDRSFTPPLHSPTPTLEPGQEPSVSM